MKIKMTPGPKEMIDLKDYQINDYHYIGDVRYSSNDFIKMAPHMGEPGHYRPVTNPVIGFWFLDPHYFD